MEKEFFLQQPIWNSGFLVPSDLNSYFSNSNLDSLMGQPDPFDAAAPSTTVPASSSGAIVEPVGRLGGIPNPEIGSGNGSFHATQLHSQPTRNPNLDPFIASDPGFAERAARFSKFGSRSFSGQSGPFGVGEGELRLHNGVGLDGGKMMTRVSSCRDLKFPGSQFGDIKDGAERKHEGFSRSTTPENGDSKEESSVSEQIPCEELGLKSQSGTNPRKRKSGPRGRKEMISKEKKIQEGAVNNEEFDTKWTKSDESNGMEMNERKKNGKAKDNSKNSSEPPKDYIHVRARRGQATDSHSLAERVRREKISQRMKFLQDLVPGCNKVTGKAVMLDEIINYVQSLQRQVEFLSMKLSTVNPKTDINVEALLSKDLQQARSLLSQSMYALESSPGASAFSYGYQSQSPPLQNVHTNGTEAPFSMSPLNPQKRNHGLQLPSMDGFDESGSQVSMWVDELHNVVHMGYGQNQQQDFQACSLITSDMKMEQ